MPAGALVRVPVLVVHGFRNASAADVRYLNFHAPGEGFAGFMRGLRDGTGERFDQHEPPADGGRPASEAAIGGGKFVETRPGVRSATLCDTDGLAITAVVAGAGADPDRDGGMTGSVGGERELEALYVLEGTLALRAGGRELSAGAGSWVQAPAGTPIAVGFPEPVRHLHVRAVAAAAA